MTVWNRSEAGEADQVGKATQGAAPAFISKGRGFDGGFQATVGVHPSAVPALSEWLERGFASFPDKKELKGARQTGRPAALASDGLPFSGYDQMSPEMEGGSTRSTTTCSSVDRTASASRSPGASPRSWRGPTSPGCSP